MSQRHIFLGMPGYGRMTAAAGRAFWNACRDTTCQQRHPGDERDKVYQEYHEGSLLASNFNALWCTALNLVYSGKRIDYFAMQHDDIACEDFWLDKLIDELEANNLDVLGVVAPIKDTRGITSIALDREDGDTWRPKCRLSMREVYRLPETFTSADVGAPLLLNTGCWVCRFDPEWVKQVYFTIKDEIVWNEQTNRYQPQVESEDWYFSRLLHECGLKIGCTRKVKLLHQGDFIFQNMQPWGFQDFDTAAVPESLIPQAPPKTEFPHDVEGWLTEKEGAILSGIANGKRVLEIGSYCGRSTICLARTAQEVVAVDPHDGRGTPNPRYTLPDINRNLARYGCRERVTIHQGTSESVNGHYAPFDFVFIDGAHELECVRRDIQAALAHLRPCGLLAFHDYHPAYDPEAEIGVTTAVDELIASGGELLALHDTLAVVKPPAAIPLEV
jgi:precorrin-6B methylase 2